MKFADETRALSSSTLDALKEFYADRDARLKQFEDLKNVAEENASNQPLTMDAFAEDWNESQFWYSDETAKMLAEELLRGADGKKSIAVVSAPSVFVQLKNLLVCYPRKDAPVYRLGPDLCIGREREGGE